MKKLIDFDKEGFKKEVITNVKTLYRRPIEEATPQQVFQAVSYAGKDDIIDRWIATHKEYEKKNVKTVYYLSMEFLMGRALGNNLINLTYYDAVKEALDELGFDLNLIEDQEPDAALGNGGLGRLAACFLDSLATLGYPAYGCGIRYRYGMFKQAIKDGYQIELPDDWLKDGNPFEIKRPEYAVEVKFGGYVRVENRDGRNYFIQDGYQTVRAVPYDVPVVGYGNNVVNTLRIWDAEADQEFCLDSFDKGEYEKAVEQQNLAKTIVEVLYPNDNHYAGKELRLRQQYFFISASVQRAILKFKEKNSDIHKLPEKITFQMNDTHPTVAVAELMRILMDEEGLEWDDAWDITTRTCAYTNHTIMAEALEKWPIELFSRLLPRIYQIVEEINRRFVLKIQSMYPGNQDKVKNMAILYDGQVKMAHLAIAGSYSVNGVAALHTKILEERELKDFYEMRPEQFNNKTNGITHRRWLLFSNPQLTQLLEDTIGDEFKTNPEKLEDLMAHVDDEALQAKFMDVKLERKKILAAYVKENLGIDIDVNSIFDCQAKRLHAYKRQLLNIFHVMYLYLRMKQDPSFRIYPRTFFYSAKAAASYDLAKEIIKLINMVANVVNNDPEISKYMKVVFIPNYSVSIAEILLNAADVSEQISTAGKEASGTGNMKYMMNGAITLGTLDGANVEIVERVGYENAEIFGLHVEDINELRHENSYNAWNLYNSSYNIRMVIDSLKNCTWSNDPNEFKLINNDLMMRNDEFFVLADFDAYVYAQEKVQARYMDKSRWAKTMLINIAKSGYFSSDRTISEYAKEIWDLKPLSFED